MHSVAQSHGKDATAVYELDGVLSSRHSINASRQASYDQLLDSVNALTRHNVTIQLDVCADCAA